MFGADSAAKERIDELKKDNKAAKTRIEVLEREARDVMANQQRTLEDLKHQHRLAIESKEFEMKFSADARVKAAEDKATALERDNAVLKKENQMFDKIVDVNKGLIDVKALVSQLISKLPEININGLTVHSEQKEDKKK